MGGDALRVLYVTNPMPPTGCGVAGFGLQQAAALRAAGLEVTVWEAGYPTYLPMDANTYDVVHVNFHPGPLGHIQGQHLPDHTLNSLHNHEFDPEWANGSLAPDLWTSPQVDLRQCSDERSGPLYWPIPIPDYRPISISMLDRPITIGYTGLRGDGLDWLIPICEKNGWRLSRSEGWRSLEEEVDRLAKCHLNVVHSHSGFSGSSSAVTTAVAARRPVLINSNRMLKGIWDLDQALGKELYLDDDLERGVRGILDSILAEAPVKRPLRLAEAYSWRKQAQKLADVWKERL